MLLRTLGGLSLEGSAFRKPKPLLLLSYLALEGPSSRRVLAELFFNDCVDPRDSLSTALGRLRGAAPGLLRTEEQTVSADVTCDAVTLLRQFDSADTRGGVEAYRGEFLKGIDVPLGLELEYWVYGTREAIAGRTRAALLTLAEQDAAAGNFSEAARLAEKVYFLSGAPEPDVDMLERIHLLLVAGGSQTSFAVQQEADSLGASLASSRQEARAALSRQLPKVTPTVPTNLPPSADAFLGRDEELAELTEMIASGEARLITILGAGGIGKSRLAMELGWRQLQAGTVSDGVFLVQLENTAAEDSIPLAIGDAVAARLLGEDPLLDQLCRYIGSQRVLLILDNFEHLVPHAGILDRLLTDCPGTTIVTTSRRRLGVAQETILALQGLQFPDADADPETAAACASMALLASRVRRKSRRFTLDETGLHDAARICRALEGMPLGIELAASWSRVLPLSAIASEIESGAGDLEHDVHGVAERHRSLRATFEHSWQLLSPAEQQTLLALVVFRSGFRREAASAVLGLTLPGLAALVDRSLLRTGARGRYDMHPLLHQYLEDKAAESPEELARARQRHARYYLDFLVGLDSSLTGGPSVGQAALAIEEELPNIRAAVEAILEGQHVAQLSAPLATLVQFAETRARYREVGQLVELVLERIDRDGAGDDLVHGLALAIMALLNYRSGHNLVAVQYAAQAAAVLDPTLPEHSVALWLTWFSAGLSSWALARPEDAAEHHQRGLMTVSAELERMQDDPARIRHARMRKALTLQNIGLTDLYFRPGREAEAEKYLLEAIEHYRAVESPYICTGLLYLGECYMAQSAYDPADDLLRSSLAIATHIGYTTGMNNASAVLARLQLLQGNLDDAIALSDRLITQVRRVGDKWAETYACAARGWSALLMGDHALADTRLRESILAAMESESYIYTMDPLLGMARLNHEAGRTRIAADIISLILRHPGTPQFVRRAAVRFAEAAGMPTGTELLDGHTAEARLRSLLLRTVPGSGALA